MPKRTAALVVLALAVAAAILTIVLDWGWSAWIAALAIAAVALIVATLRSRPVLRTAAVVAAVAVIAAGILVVRIPPITSAGWEAGSDALLIAADDKLAVTLNQETHALRSRAISDGREVWRNSFGSSEAVRWQQLGTDAVLLYGDDQASVVSISDGKTRWGQDVGQQEPFTTNGDVVVFSGNKTTTGVELRTGKKLWTYAGEATAGSGGQSSYNARRWVPRSDWIVIRGGSGSAPVTVLDAGTGQVAATVRVKSNDFVVAGKSFVEFDYTKLGRRLAKGTPLGGGQPWQAEFGRSNSQESLDVVDGKVRALYDTKAVYLDPESGALREVAIEDDWSVNWFNGGFGGRYVAVKQRDRDHVVNAWAVADTVTGKLVDLAGRGQTIDLTIEQFANDTAISRTTVVDAVGAKSDRYAWITDGADHGRLSTTGSRQRVESAADVVQLGQRILVLRKD
jgi:hypothetical protein